MQPVELSRGVISDPQIVGGKPILKGTRVPVALVLGKLAGGMSTDEVMYEYYLTPEQLRAAFDYAAQRLNEEVIYATQP